MITEWVTDDTIIILKKGTLNEQSGERKAF
jgi:hypothetical protein